MISVFSDLRVQIASESACRMLDGAGTHVNHETGIAKIPEDLGERWVSSSIETLLGPFDRTALSFILLEERPRRFRRNPCLGPIHV